MLYLEQFKVLAGTKNLLKLVTGLSSDTSNTLASPETGMGAIQLQSIWRWMRDENYKHICVKNNEQLKKEFELNTLRNFGWINEQITFLKSMYSPSLNIIWSLHFFLSKLASKANIQSILNVQLHILTLRSTIRREF